MSFGEDLKKIIEENHSGLLGKHPDWERVLSDHVITVTNGFPFKSKHFNKTSGTPVLRIRDILKGQTNTFFDGTIDPKACYVTNGEIVVGMDGDFNSRIWQGGKVFLNQRVCKINTNSEYYDQRFYSYLLPGYLKAIHSNTSAVTVKHLSSKTIQDIPLPLPPFNEQRRIVDKIEQLFSNLDEGEALLNQVQEQLETYRQSVLKAAVTGELTKEWREANKGRLEPGEVLLKHILKARRNAWQGKGKYKEPEPTKNSLPFNLPKEWSKATIDQLSSAVDYGSSAKCNQQNDGVAVLRMGNIQNGTLDLKNLKYLPQDHDEFPKLLLENGDLLFNRTNSAELVGKTAIYKGSPKICSFASYLIRVKLTEIEPEFVSAYINSAYGKGWIKSVVSQQVGQANVNGTKLKALSIPLPSKEEQEEIVSLINDIFSQIDALESWCASELARSSALRQSILKDAFSGKLVPQDPNDEPASELLKRIQAEKPKAATKTPVKRGRKKKVTA